MDQAAIFIENTLLAKKIEQEIINRELFSRLLSPNVAEQVLSGKLEVKKGGIIIPDTAKEKPQQGKVIALGTGKVDDNGKAVPFNVKVGDLVLMPKYGGTEVKIDDREFQIVREDDILGVIES